MTGSEALIHLRVPAELKARWVRESRAAGMRLTDWIVSRVEAQPMNSDQFQALAQLLRLRQGPQREAARLVLVDGVRQADAARMAGCSASALGNTLRTCRAGLELARLAAGG